MSENDFYKANPKLASSQPEISSALQLIISTYKTGNKVLVCGNGGSAADSEHIVGELMKGFNFKRPLTKELKEKFSSVENGSFIAENLQTPLCAISLVSHSALISAYANDCRPELVYAQQVLGFGEENDLLIALSTSGNSKNVVYAAQTAKVLGLKVISITGGSTSNLSRISDVTVMLPAFTPFEVQELTLPVYHYLCAETEKTFFRE